MFKNKKKVLRTFPTKKRGGGAAPDKGKKFGKETQPGRNLLSVFSPKIRQVRTSSSPWLLKGRSYLSTNDQPPVDSVSQSLPGYLACFTSRSYTLYTQLPYLQEPGVITYLRYSRFLTATFTCFRSSTSYFSLATYTFSSVISSFLLDTSVSRLVFSSFSLVTWSFKLVTYVFNFPDFTFSSDKALSTFSFFVLRSVKSFLRPVISVFLASIVCASFSFCVLYLVHSLLSSVFF